MKKINIVNKKKWYLIDGKDKTLGRISTLITKIIMGKHKPNYVPFTNCGDYVVVINAEHIKVTGKKNTQKTYHKHSGRPGGLKIQTFESLRERIPELILEKSIKGMLPKGPLGRNLYKNLKVFKGDNHPYISQKPNFLT